MSVPRDREVRERERLSRVWAALGEEQDSMKRQGESLNNLTKQLENLRTRLDAEDANFGSFTEALLVQVLDVEQNIKKGLDFMEKVLGKEKKRFHKASTAVLCSIQSQTNGELPFPRRLNA